MEIQCSNFDCQWVGTRSEQITIKEGGFSTFACPKCSCASFYDVEDGKKVKLVKAELTIQIPDHVEDDEFEEFVEDSIRDGEYDSLKITR